MSLRNGYHWKLSDHIILGDYQTQSLRPGAVGFRNKWSRHRCHKRFELNTSLILIWRRILYNNKDIMMARIVWWQRNHDDKDVFFRCGELLREELPVQVSPWIFVHLMWLICEYQGGESTVDCWQKRERKAISKVLMGTDLVARRAKEERHSARTFPWF